MSPRLKKPSERRQNRPLREVLDDLLTHAREIARRAKAMTPAELDYAQQRLEWLADEVWRVLRPGGVCFFSGPNRLALMEEHYWLPLLSWLPRPAAHLYMRAFKRGRWYDAYPRFYWQIRSLWRAFTIHDYTLPMLREPERFAVDRRFGKIAWIGRLPARLLGSLAFLVPNFNWVLVKPA